MVNFGFISHLSEGPLFVSCNVVSFIHNILQQNLFGNVYFHFNHDSSHQNLQRFFYVFVYIHFSVTLFTDKFEGSSLSIICTVICGTLVLGT